MQQKLMVLLVEDDIQACEAIVDCCLSSNDITLTNVTNNSVKAIEMIQSYLPDAIILDLELHHGSGNGFQVLQGLKDLHLDHKPYILVTTNNTSAVMYETARQLGADFIMSKHQDDYSAQSVIDFLTMMKPVIQTHPQVGGPYTSVSPERLHQLRLQRIRTELRLVGISPKAIGYLYLIDAIDLGIAEYYKSVAQRFAPSADSIAVSVKRAALVDPPVLDSYSRYFAAYALPVSTNRFNQERYFYSLNYFT